MRNSISPIAVATAMGKAEAEAQMQKSAAASLLRGYKSPRIELALTLAKCFASGELAEWDPAVARAVVSHYAAAAGRKAPAGQSLAVQASKLSACVRAGTAFVITIERVRRIVDDASDNARMVYLRDAQNKAIALGRACFARGRALTDDETMRILNEGASDDERVYRLVSTALSCLNNAAQAAGDKGAGFNSAIDQVSALVDHWRTLAEAARRDRLVATGAFLDADRADVDAETEGAVPAGSADSLL